MLCERELCKFTNYVKVKDKIKLEIDTNYVNVVKKYTFLKLWNKTTKMHL